MPVYAYRCDSCQHEFDELRDITESDVATTCPECKSDQCKKIFKPIPIRFKGPGFTTRGRG